MSESKQFNIVLPTPLHQIVTAVGETGYYENSNEFITEAVRVLIAARKDVRIEIACRLYAKEEISLGRAMEIAGVDIERMKEELHRRGIPRTVSTSWEETYRMAQSAMVVREQ